MQRPLPELPESVDLDRSEEQFSETSSYLSEEDTESQFDAGKFALHLVALLMWLDAGLRLYKVADLVALLTKMRTELTKIAPVLKSQSEANSIVNWLIVLLSQNVATTVGILTACVYVTAVYQCQSRCCGRTSVPTEKRVKQMLRTLGTALFYLALLPDALATLGLSGLVSGLNLLTGQRLLGGQLFGLDATRQLVQNFRCSAAATALECWGPDGDGPGAREFFGPVRRHLRKCYLPEATVQMLLILLAFLVTHLIRARGRWGQDHRKLLQQTAFCRLPQLRQSGLTLESSSTSTVFSNLDSELTDAQRKKVS